MRAWVYVDGFNLYYGSIRRFGLKWVNLKALAEQVLPKDWNIERVKYFTARVSGAVDPDAPRRQQMYLRALNTVPEIETHFGEFLSKTAWRPIMNLPVADKPIDCEPQAKLPQGKHRVHGERPQNLVVGRYPEKGQRRPNNKSRRPEDDPVIAEVHTMEEKGSDVNLAAHLLNDAWKKEFEVAAVLSCDTDLVAPIRMVTQERGLHVLVVSTSRWGVSDKLKRVASGTRHIHRAMLEQALFRDKLPGTDIEIPADWKPK